MPDADPQPTPPASRPSWLARQRALPRDARRYLWGASLMGVGYGATWVHLNLFYKASGLGEHAIGTLLAVTSIGGTLVALPAAALVERFPTGRILALASLGFSVTLALQLLVPFVPFPALHLALWGLISFASGVLFTIHHVAAAPFFMRAVPDDMRADLFGVAQAVETAATLFGGLGVGYIADGLTPALGSEAASLRVGLLAAAVATLPAVLAFLRIENVPTAQAHTHWLAPLRIENKGLLFRLTFPAAVVGLGAGLTIPFLNLYFRDRFALDPGQIGETFALGQVLTTGAFLAGPIVARRIGTVAAIVGTELASIPFFLVLAFAHSLPWAVAAFWMRSALMQMNQPISTAFALEQVPESQRAAVNSVRHVAWNLAWAASTQVGGVWIAASGHTPPMLATVGLYVIASASFWWFFGRGRPAVSGR